MMSTIDDKRLNEMIAGMKLYADMPYGVKINEFSAKELYAAMVELRELRAAGQWVPVSLNILPDDGQEVFITFINAAGEHVSESTFKNGKFYYVAETDHGYYEEIFSCVTHWMPKPLPPLLAPEATNA